MEQRSELLEQTLALLVASEEPSQEMAKGAEVGFEWLRALRRKAQESPETVGDPGVKRIQRLYNYLASRAQRSPERQTRNEAST